MPTQLGFRVLLLSFMPVGQSIIHARRALHRVQLLSFMPVGQSIIHARRAFHAKAVRVFGSIVYSIFHGFIQFSVPDLRAGAKDALKKIFALKKYLH